MYHPTNKKQLEEVYRLLNKAKLILEDLSFESKSLENGINNLLNDKRYSAEYLNND